jgi:hypothetical protein
MDRIVQKQTHRSSENKGVFRSRTAIKPTTVPIEGLRFAQGERSHTLAVDYINEAK